jgi:hypothetical protein
MMYYLAKVESGEDGTLTATYRERNSTQEAGLLQWRVQAEAIRWLPTMLELTSPGGVTQLSTPVAPEGGRHAGGAE